MAVEVTVLGTASGLPAPDRFGQTVVLSVDGALHLLDCGDGASSLLMRHGFEHTDLRSIFISHMHGDHHAGLVQTVKTCMHREKRDELVVLGPGEGIRILREYLEASYLFGHWLRYPIRWIPLTGCVGSMTPLPCGVALEVHPNDHLAWYRETARKMESLPRAYTFESYSAVYHAGGRRIVYSGNLHGPRGSDEMAPFVEPCDLLITELAHVEPVELGRFLAGRDIAHTVVTHFHPRWNGVADSEIAALIDQGAKRGRIRGCVSLAHDGDRFTC